MAKINKVYPSFYNGISEQPAELMLDTQCKDMVNCVPSVIKGLTKRPPVSYIANLTFSASHNKRVIHTYDRGDGIESYIFLYDTTTGLSIYSKDAVAKTVVNNAIFTAYVAGTDGKNIKGLTVGDTTWLYRTDAVPTITTIPAISPNYARTAYYWIKRASGDRYNPYNYAVYLNDITVACNPDKPSSATTDPATGFEDSDYALSYLQKILNREQPVIRKETNNFAASQTKTVTIFIGQSLTSVAVTVSSGFTINSQSYNSTTGYISINITNNNTDGDIEYPSPVAATCTISVSAYIPVGFSCERSGNVLKIWKTDGSDFAFSSWDSWGNQASEGWKGKIQKLQDLPGEFGWTNAYVSIEGSDNSRFTDYYVKWNGTTWEETRDPTAVSYSFGRMPIKVERTGVDTFTVSECAWEQPKVGNNDNNPYPSFLPITTSGSTINHMVFYKNRLGLVYNDGIVLSEVGGYYNFFAKSVLDILDTDPMDISVGSNQASKLYYAIPFNSSLYLFTRYSQFELTSEGYLSPKTISVQQTTNYPVDTDIEPRVVNSSLFFVSTVGSKQQLREYIKNEKLSVEGVDLNITAPSIFEHKVTNLLVNGTLGYVLCTTDTGTIYIYNYLQNNNERIQSAWSKWQIPFNLLADDYSTQYGIIDNYVTIYTTYLQDVSTKKYQYNRLDLSVEPATCIDALFTGVTSNVVSSIKLPVLYPHLLEIGTPKDPILLKKASINGDGNFSAKVYRKDYDREFVKQFDYGMKDKDFHIQSKTDKCDIIIEEASSSNFRIDSVVVEGLFTPTSKQIK